MENLLSDSDELARLHRWFEQTEDASVYSRKLAQRDRDYYDGKQLTPEEIEVLAARGQPAIVINRIKRKINFLLGLEKLERSDPRAFPRNPSDVDAAHAATDAIRFVADSENYDKTRSLVWQNMLIEGFGAVEVAVEFEADEPVIRLHQWPWERLFFDPYSQKDDFSDARYKGTVTWLDLDEAKRRYPGRAEDLESVYDLGHQNGGIGDRNSDFGRTNWMDHDRNRIKIIQIYWKEAGNWFWCVFCGDLKLGGGPVPFKDDRGRSVCPLEMQSAYVDRENNRYGEVRDLIAPQDEVNKRRSKALHILNTRQVIADRGAVDDPHGTRRELAKPDGFVEKNAGFEFRVEANADLAQGQLGLLQEAKAELDLVGPNASLMGQNQSAQQQSGRAIMAGQQIGSIEIAELTDKRNDLDLRVYRQIWWRIRQYWTSQKWVRVTDDDDNARFVGFNRPVHMAEAIREGLLERGFAPHEIDDELLELADHPGMAEIARIANQPAQTDVDIVIDRGPATPTLLAEQFTELTALAQAGVPIPPVALVEASSIRNKQRVLDLMQAAGVPGTPQPQPQPAAAPDPAQPTG